MLDNALVGANYATVDGVFQQGAAYLYPSDTIFSSGFDTPAL
ncbi:MAG TPA: hypothetical protein VFG55_02910 [Rhodanobacteraceae bacterium]|nr:hypothetical protein [Rhodanobacteraceae bacterium]